MKCRCPADAENCNILQETATSPQIWPNTFVFPEIDTRDRNYQTIPTFEGQIQQQLYKALFGTNPTKKEKSLQPTRLTATRSPAGNKIDLDLQKIVSLMNWRLVKALVNTTLHFPQVTRSLIHFCWFPLKHKTFFESTCFVQCRWFHFIWPGMWLCSTWPWQFWWFIWASGKFCCCLCTGAKFTSRDFSRRGKCSPSELLLLGLGRRFSFLVYFAKQSLWKRHQLWIHDASHFLLKERSRLSKLSFWLNETLSTVTS